jgi:hypothetical protein
LFQVKKVKKEKKRNGLGSFFGVICQHPLLGAYGASVFSSFILFFFSLHFFGWLPRVVGTDYKNWKHVEPRFDSLYTY